MIEFLLLDLDDTILDFHKAESIAVAKALNNAGAPSDTETIARYSEINKLHWQRLERGEITRQQVLVGRFAVLFQEIGLEADAEKCARDYEQLLGIGHYFLPGAEEAVWELKKEYRLFLTSNGTQSVQHSRLTSANLYPAFEKVFVSQEIGADKPSAAYFEKVFASIPDFDKEKAMIVGDSLTSDILGGMNAGIKTCWVNPKHLPRKPGIIVNYEIESIVQLKELLKSI